MLRTVLLSLALFLPSAATADDEDDATTCADTPDCVGPEGYTPPTYSAAELLGFLSTVPTVAANPASLFTGFWTNWDAEPETEPALVKLAVQRIYLERANLHHPYLPGALTDNVAPGDIVCDPHTLTERTIDGTCNDLADPAAGAVNTRFGRNVPLSAAYPDTANLLNPDPREISLRLLRRRGPMKRIPHLNMWAAAWTQFQIHDWFDHGTPDASRPLSIPLDARDPMRRRTGQSAIVVGSTPKDSSRLTSEAGLPPTYQNVVTHWWDASQIYGSDLSTAARLRTFSGGKLKLDSKGRLPKNARGFGDSGFTSNWWVGLELLHTLFVKEHNAIADHLAAKYPSMTDEELYQKARLINAALLAKIHTLEWTPAILPNRKLDLAMNANWYGLQRYVDPDPVQQATLRAVVPPPDPVIYGIVGGEADNKGVPFSITSEFAAIYRMHQLTPDRLVLRNRDGRVRGLVDTVDATNGGARTLVETVPEDAMHVSFGLQRPGALVLQNYPEFMTRLKLPMGTEIDLASIDILRDRERGIPRYNEFRRLIGLVPLSSIDDLTPDPTHRRILKSVYKDINEVDLFVGTLAEADRPECFGFGETLFQTFILMASRRLEADRFYTDDYNASVYTPEGLAWVENNTFKSVLLRHNPSLASTGLADVDNAFNPWDTRWTIDGSPRGGDGDDYEDDDDGGRWERDDDDGGRWERDDDDGGRWERDDDDGGRWERDDDDDDRRGKGAHGTGL